MVSVVGATKQAALLYARIIRTPSAMRITLAAPPIRLGCYAGDLQFRSNKAFDNKGYCNGSNSWDREHVTNSLRRKVYD